MMPTDATLELRRWAHEDAFVRGDEPPHISCDEILATIDALCDEIDGRAPKAPSIDHYLTVIWRVVNADKNATPEMRERIGSRLVRYLNTARRLAQELGEYRFETLCLAAYEATIDVWDLTQDEDACRRLCRLMEHVTCVDLSKANARTDLACIEKKALAAYLVATGRLTS